MLTDFRVRQRDYLLEITRAITAQLDLDAVLRLVVEAAAEMLAGQVALIALREEDAFTIRAAYGLPDTQWGELDVLLAKLPAHPESWGRAEVERVLTQIARWLRLEAQQAVALPLMVGEELLGLLVVFRTFGTAFTYDDRLILRAFADQAAIAVHNAKLYQQLVTEKRRLEAIIEATADGVIILDPAHRIQVFNRAMARLTGWSPLEAIGRPHDEIVILNPRRSGMTLAEAEAGGWPLATDRPIYVEGDLVRRDGGRVAVGITYSPLLDRTGRLVNIIGVVRDMTRIREAEELKSTFISIISHELKTPVSIIKGYAGTLRREDTIWDTAMVRQIATIIEEEADRLTQLIDNLLDASRLQAGALELQFVEVALDELAERVADRFRPQTDRHFIVVDFPPDFPLIQGDPRRLEQVLANLVSNAIKYSPQGGTIRISGRVTPREVIVTVTDEGIGILPEEQERIFERFYRASAARARQTPGTGLGLYLARAIVEAHGGRIWVESTPGRGSSFSFSLPRPQGS
ncbi:ATP-binding protein [Thermoflexus sp.]|uniref:ATP-binding protein n=1 Tax=Thermoflexus sp. TaxID=1969742 RepID=UPI002ADDDEFD|nr:ATP-binding protein [Thermoflexus sp.]